VDGWGTEGAGVALVWHAVNEVRKLMKPDIRGSDLKRIEKAIEKVSDKLESLTRQVDRLNGGPKSG